MQQLAELLLKYFQGNLRYYPVWEENSKTPTPFEVRHPLTPEQFSERHMSGKKCLGFYLIRPQDDTCLCSCLDFDNHDGTKPEATMNARMVYKYLQALGQHPLLERSQGGEGYHVWLLHEKPIPARTVRKAWRHILSECQLSGIEIYPRQDTVQHLEGRLGNLIRYPLWNHSQFEDASGIAQDALETLQNVRTTPESFFESKAVLSDSRCLDGDITRVYITEGLPPRVEALLNSNPTSLLAKRWQCDSGGMQGDKSRSTLAMSICAELVRHMIPTPEIEAALRYWCQIQQYEKSDRWIERTVAAGYDYAEPRGAHVQTARNVAGILHSQLDILAQGPPLMIPSGVESLDMNLGGGLMEVGELCLLGARANSGKTAFSISVMDAATHAGYPSVFYSLEMSARSVAARYLLRMGVDPQSVPNVRLKDLHDLVDEKMKGVAPLDFQNVRHLKEILPSIKDYAKRGYRLAVIDYMGIIKTDERDELRSYELIARELAECSKDNDIAIILLHQFGRDYEKRGGGRPKMSDFRYAGEADADVMLGAQYVYKEQPIPENKTKFYMHVLKTRNRGFEHPYVELNFNPDRQTFSAPQF